VTLRTDDALADASVAALVDVESELRNVVTPLLLRIRLNLRLA
jgi:hypothetical protein